jgi:Zn finger protein HypA/HybF involved in hydrogenase expression
MFESTPRTNRFLTKSGSAQGLSERSSWFLQRPPLHELSLVEGIIQSVGDLAATNGKQVKSVSVSVGELAQFDLRVIRELLAELKGGTPLEGARIQVRLEKAKVKCLNCKKEWTFGDVVGPLSKDEKEVVHFFPEILSTYSRCPSCNRNYLEIEKGRSVRIAEVRFES